MSLLHAGVVPSYVYNQVFNSNVDENPDAQRAVGIRKNAGVFPTEEEKRRSLDGDNELLTRGGMPASELLNHDSMVGGGGKGLENKVVPIGLSVILRQPKRNTEYSVEKGQGCAVVPEDLFDRLFGSVQPAASKKRVTKSNRQKLVIKGTKKGTHRKSNEKST